MSLKCSIFSSQNLLGGISLFTDTDVDDPWTQIFEQRTELISDTMVLDILM